MSNDMYDDGNLDALQDNVIRPSDDLAMAPDAIALGGASHHQGADYGLPDTTVRVVAGRQCVHDGVVYGSGETLDAPKAGADFMIRSGWATTEPEPESEPVTKAQPKAPAKRQAVPGTRRRG